MALLCPVRIKMFFVALVAVSGIHADNIGEQGQASHEVTANGALVGMESRRASVMRSNPWPPLKPDNTVDDDFNQQYQIAESIDDINAAAAVDYSGDYSREDSTQPVVPASRQLPVVTPAIAPVVLAAQPVVVQVSPTKATNPTPTADLENVRSVSTTIGVMLLGMVTFVMSIFYASHFPDPHIQHTTWVTLSQSISLFSSVLIFTSFKDVMTFQFGELGGHHDSIPDLKSMIISFIRLLVAFWGSQLLLLKFRHTNVPLKAWASIGGNVVAFAAIDSFSMIQQCPPFRDNPANVFLGCTVAAFMIMCMCASAHIVREWLMTYEDGSITEHERNWNEHCKILENQFASICIGLLFSVVVRFSISGSLPPTWGSPRNKTQEQVEILFGVSLGFAVPVFASSMAAAALERHRVSIPGVVRAATVMQLILSMCMGWNLAFCGQWEFWSATKGKGVGLGDKMTARMIDALMFSYISFGFIIVLDYVADHMQVARAGFTAVGNAFVLGLGLSWQGCFSEACHALSLNFKDQATRTYMDVLMCLLVCAVVLPAWVMYMLPKALAGPEKLKGEGEHAQAVDGEGADKPIVEEEALQGEDAHAPEVDATSQMQAEATGSGGGGKGAEGGKAATAGGRGAEGGAGKSSDAAKPVGDENAPGVQQKAHEVNAGS